MRFWFREIVGWLLVGLGLLVFYGCYELLIRGRVAETGALTVIGIFVFRGGIHLLKMAVAARICLQAQERLRRDDPRSAEGPIINRPGTRYPRTSRPTGGRRL